MNRFGSLRYKLLSLVLIPLLLLSGTVIVAAYSWSSKYTYEQLFAKVHTDLRVAHDRFFDIKARGERQLEAIANSVQLVNALELGDTELLNKRIGIESELGNFDFLNLLSSDGKKILDGQGWKAHQFRRTPLSEKVVSSRAALTVSGIEIYSAAQWQHQPGLDGAKVSLPLLQTVRAVPTQRQVEDRAMFIRTLRSVYDNSGDRVAILESGMLLNRNFEFVDGIRDLVYGPGSLTPDSRGTVTVFLDDVRITTNVLLEDRSRALGTRVSAEVRDAVLGRGETWVNRAFVVNDWYVSAYEPIIDSAGERVGMLYAGYLEAPFRADQFKAFSALTALVLAGSLAAAIAAIMGARSIFSPIETMTSVVEQHPRVSISE